MKKVRTLGAVTATTALVLFGGVAAVRQQVPPQLDVDSLATELGWSAEVKAQLAPQIDELNSLLARRGETRAEHQQLRTQFQDVQASVAETLTAEQQARFWGEIRQTVRPGLGMGMGGGLMGAMGYGGHMGNGGPMGRGGHVGLGIPMHNNHPGAGYMGRGSHMGPGEGSCWTNGGSPAGS